MAISCARSLRHISTAYRVIGVVSSRGFAAGAKSKKAGEGGSADALKEVLTKEMKSTTVYEANILKDGSDPKILPDSEYHDWLWHLLDKRLPLSELQRKDTLTLPYEDLKRFVKLDNRARIKENNAARAKN